MDAFQTFLASGLYGNSKTMLKFLGLWRRRVLNLPVEKEVTLEAFVAGTGINPRRVDKLCTELGGRLVEFLSFQEYREQEYVQQEMLLRAMMRRNANLTEMHRQHHRIQKTLEERKESPDKELQRLKLRWVMAETAVKSRTTRTLWQEDFLELSQALDAYYRLQKLKLASAHANARSIYRHEEVNPLADFLKNMEEGSGEMDLSPLARAYFLSVQMLQEETAEARFPELIQLLGAHAAEFAVEEATELYGYALNFCIRKSNEHQSEYLGYMSDLYLQLLDNGLLLQGGKLVPSQFKNIVTLHCRLGKLDWVREFIQEYKDKLTEGTEAKAVQYNAAILAYHEKNYSMAIRSLKEMIQELKDDVFYGLDARIYLWKSYFENFDALTVEEVDEMYKLYDSFRIFIDRNESLADTRKTQYRNFIREFKRFMEFLTQDPVSPAEIEQLKREVANMEFISNKEWFLHHITARLEKVRGQ